MRNRELIGACVLGVVLSGSVAAGQDVGRYREFELGTTVAAVATLTGIATSELKAIHQRPAIIQEITWRPRYRTGRSLTAEIESVEQVVFDFHDDRLFRVTVGYDRKQTEGLTDADMIEAIAAVYGSQVNRVAPRRRQPTTTYDDAGIRIAEWGTEGNSVALYRLSSYATSFRLVITDESVAALARTAAARAVVLDAREAPQREAAREKKEAEDRRAAEEKARLANKAIFRP
jgi:hypothetical protein